MPRKKKQAKAQAVTTAVAPVAVAPQADSVSMFDDKTSWGLILLQGILVTLMGWLLLTRPIASTFVLVQVIGFFWIIDGAISVVRSLVHRKEMKGWGWTLIMGLIGIFAGYVVLDNKIMAAALTPTIFLYMMAFVFMIQGTMKMIMGKQVADTQGYERTWGSFFAGLFILLVGVALIAMPLIAGLSILVLTVGWLAVFAGIFLMVAAFQVRKYQHAVA